MIGDSVRTPQYIIDYVKKHFGEYYDPCPYNPEFDKTKDKDGLLEDWGKVTYCNPPYSEVNKWVRKGHEEYKKGKTVIMLIKVRNLATIYAEKYMKEAEIVLLPKKIIFPGYKSYCRFGSVMLIYRANKVSGKFRFLNF